MGLCVLLSAMHLKDHGILDTLNIRCDAIIINQCDRRGAERITDENGRRILFYSTDDRGLSKSRNLGLKLAMDPFFDRDDICIFCDNDCVYEDGAHEKIEAAFAADAAADIMVFFIKRPERLSPIRDKSGPLGYAGSMKIFSPEIAFRKKSLQTAHLNMDTLFGAGARYGMGEENIFLFDALRMGLKVKYVPLQIAHLLDTESTWFKGYTDKYFIDRGAGYRRMSPAFCGLLILQFALRKYSVYKSDNTLPNALYCMIRGAAEYSGRRIFVVGDYSTGTGPANATMRLLDALPCDTLRQSFSGKVMRLLELFIKIPVSGLILLSGHSRQNLYALKIAHFLKKPVWFWMHGCVEHENRINGEEDEEMTRVERRVLKESDRILAVSPSFEGWLKENYPGYSEKISCLPNGTDISFSGPAPDKTKGNDGILRIMSVGGGMIRKRIVKIAEAADMLNKEGAKCTLTVIGKPGGDSGLLEKYDCVIDRGTVSEEEAMRLMAQADIYVQNSSFETFGLAPLEALSQGCSLLLSRHIGALCVFNDSAIKDTDIICDCEDAAEIAGKLRHLSSHPNHSRLTSGIDPEKTSWQYTAALLR